ncbi:hypothetical protein [Synechococcus sp. PCC 7336]|uniref:hypothetical protein n=1 Tax=Synechococcus sp. PCC 7336 TaxID=195250 RepID=UPI00034B7EA9|nr:hypothetical protein [Synechococcus sp. PCC 7336]
MTYRELQQHLRDARNEGRTTIKLNASTAELQAEYDRLVQENDAHVDELLEGRGKVPIHAKPTVCDWPVIVNAPKSVNDTFGLAACYLAIAIVGVVLLFGVEVPLYARRLWRWGAMGCGGGQSGPVLSWLPPAFRTAWRGWGFRYYAGGDRYSVSCDRSMPESHEHCSQ